MDISLTIKNIKNIKNAELELPFEKGLHAIVGGNGCGKSTLMLALSLMIKPSSAKMLHNIDMDDESQIKILVEDKEDVWFHKNGKNFYKVICANLDRIGLKEEQFITYLCDDIYNYENMDKFVSTLTGLLGGEY